MLCEMKTSGQPARSHGVCVECIHPDCDTAMHVTCAQYMGLTFQEDQDTRISGFQCPNHLVNNSNIYIL